MKHTLIKTIIGTALLSLFLIGCSDILDEQPRSIYTPDYFKTEAGVMGGLTSEYASLRRMWGDAYFYSNGLTGTDEATWAASGGQGNFKIMDISGEGNITANASDASGLWSNAFPAINTANGIIENATAVGTISEALIAEARFFRAFYYFYLVQNFGGVPLDLGVGELKFNTQPVRKSLRNTVPEVYTKAIFPDLLAAIDKLPDAGRLTGALTKTAARLILSKAYLTYAWWLENPNNIPTYPSCDRKDSNGHDAKWYYQQAYDLATTAIDNPGSFGLCATYYDINVAKNDRNKEMVLYADRTQANEYYNDANLSYASGGGADNFAAWMMTWGYTAMTSSKTSWASPSACNSVQREAEQHLGRPWTRMAPPIEVFTQTFAEKKIDSRFDGTFVTTYRGNWNKAGISNATLYNANDMQIKQGDAVLTFLSEEPVTPLTYYAAGTTDHSGVGAAEVPGRADWVIAPSGISRVVYPGCGYKIGTYRTDNGSGLGSPNGSITRPFPVAKFSEFYFIAAEAAVKGATTVAGKSAYDLINVIRARAGKWSFDNNGNVAKVEDHSAEMVAATPTTIDMNYILAERSREYYGEGVRWYDLVRTQTWGTIAHSYTICGTAIGDHTPKTVTRLIDNHHYLRPIPQGQLDGLEMTTEEKAAYQNPGY
jgi:starch-binding outer membrane protein, SusD/RagB family